MQRFHAPDIGGGFGRFTWTTNTVANGNRVRGSLLGIKKNVKSSKESINCYWYICECWRRVWSVHSNHHTIANSNMTGWNWNQFCNEYLLNISSMIELFTKGLPSLASKPSLVSQTFACETGDYPVRRKVRRCRHTSVESLSLMMLKMKHCPSALMQTSTFYRSKKQISR